MRGAVGWLELANPQEALAELAGAPKSVQGHPDALEVCWQALSELKDWPQALKAARQLITTAPERATGYINQSFALHEMRQTREALVCLLPHSGRFPEVGVIPYNLACYACQLNDLETARHWLVRASKILGQGDTKIMVLKDPDLTPLRPMVRDW